MPLTEDAPILVTRQDGGGVVIISAEDFAGWEATVYLLRNPANASHLLASIAEAEAGLTTQHDLAAEGLGKAEALRGDLAGWWSRRIAGEHRLIYRIAGRAGTGSTHGNRRLALP